MVAADAMAAAALDASCVRTRALQFKRGFSTWSLQFNRDFNMVLVGASCGRELRRSQSVGAASR
jgi:hypothetical protein